MIVGQQPFLTEGSEHCIRDGLGMCLKGSGSRHDVWGTHRPLCAGLT